MLSIKSITDETLHSSALDELVASCPNATRLVYWWTHNQEVGYNYEGDVLAAWKDNNDMWVVAHFEQHLNSKKFVRDFEWGPYADLKSVYDKLMDIAVSGWNDDFCHAVPQFISAVNELDKLTEPKEPTREEKLRQCERELAWDIKAAIQKYLGLGHVDDVGFDYDSLSDGFLKIGVDFYDEPLDD